MTKRKMKPSGKAAPSEARRWRGAVVVTTLLTCGVAYAYCPPQYVNEWVAPYFVQATQTLNGQINAVDTMLSQQLNLNSERLTSAVAVLTKQKAVAANQVADASRNTAQQTATALNVLAQTERVKAARFDFGAEFGQGYAPCRVYAARRVISEQDAEQGLRRRQAVMQEVYAAPGRYADPIAAQHQLIADNAPFCTQDQVDSGLCKSVGEIPGASLSFSTMFQPSMEGERLNDAKVAFVNNIAGLPDGPVPKTAASTPAAAAYSLAKSRKDAVISPALTTFKELQLEYSGGEVEHGGTSLPLGVHFRNEVNRYAGNSPEHTDWAKVMSSQNERGALVELLKVKALNLAIQERQYRQYERMEANLAALVAMEVGDTELGRLQTNASQRASRQSAAEAVR
ncbi:hypothetical protein [Xanthomonas oryzae]|uniref:hypothetical protein n=1 Tax=Xanthomonas oryzae TaxID=347 RepID=UPI003DA0AA22